MSCRSAILHRDKLNVALDIFLGLTSFLQKKTLPTMMTNSVYFV